MDDQVIDASLKQSHSSCKACQSEINASADICPICKSYQSRWKRELYYIATMAGIITVAISLLTYVASTWPEIKKTFFWTDAVEVIAFHSKKNIVIHNSGDGRVFVSHLLLRSSEFSYASTFRINKMIESKSFLVHELNTTTQDWDKWDTGLFIDEFWQKIGSVNLTV